MNVYRIDGQTGKSTIVAEGILGPNGLCFSPDEKILYVIEIARRTDRKISPTTYPRAGDYRFQQAAVRRCRSGIPTACGPTSTHLWWRRGMGGSELDGVVVYRARRRVDPPHRTAERCANLCFGG